MNSFEIAKILNAMDLHIHRDDRGLYWTIPNEQNTVVRITSDYNGHSILRITDQYGSLYSVHAGVEEIRTRIQFIMCRYDQKTDRN